ncbi:hypothetical protein EJB05_06046 [Eragrostis curvula]|uniref:Cathepsin propeptide inhibitor domain-containing protein n=1 Tax=Eragrostis curvula TaxID=38414 RepID=A0A5J9WEY2_9POAL|nr:hypothetical protein EJB05_06046 [Eragrostis curvula]
MALSSGAMPVFALILLIAFMFAGASPASESVDAAGDKLMMDRFVRWQAAYERSYATAEEKQRRFEVYRRNMEYIDATNRAGNLTYQLGENQFADLTPEEFLDTYTMKGMPKRVDDDGIKANASFPDVDAPTSVDWRSQGAVTPIKTQGTCSSCWAFVTAATIESLNKIRNGRLVSLSEQELVDCDPYDGGCNRGHFTNGYRWVIENGGLTTSADYPYQGRRGPCSRAKAANRVASISDYVRVPSGEASLLRAVAQQPVAAGVQMTGDLQFYSGGVFSGECAGRENHGVTVVGYGADASTGLKYWIVKNSWGTGWGERGYVRLRRDVGGGGMCGIAVDLAYPVM